MNYGIYSGGLGFTPSLTRCQVINWALQGIYGQGGLSLVDSHINTTTSSTSADISGWKIVSNSAGFSIDVDDLSTITINHAGASGKIRGFWAKPLDTADTGQVVNIGGNGSTVNVDITTTNAATIIVHSQIGDASGRSTAQAAMDNTVTQSAGPSLDVSGPMITADDNASAIPTTLARIKGVNSSHSGSVPTSGRACLIGSDSNSITVGGVDVTGVDCTDNEFTNFSHGVELGGLASQSASRNKITGCSESLINKRSIACRQYSSQVINPRPVALRHKSSLNCSLDNNVIYLSDDISGIFNGMIVYDNDGSTSSSGNKTQNNSVYVAAGGRVNRVIHGDTDSVGEWTASNNNYYAVDGWPTAATNFANIDSVTYDFATYQSTFEISATDVDTQPVNPPADLQPTAGGNGGLLGSVVGLSDFNNVLFPDPPPWGAYNLLAGASPTLTNPYSIGTNNGPLFTIKTSDTLATIEGAGFFNDNAGYASLLKTGDVVLIEASNGTKLYNVTVDKTSRIITLSTGTEIA